MLRICASVVMLGAAAMAVTAQSPAVRSDGSVVPVTFAKDVLPILQRNCQSCHRPGQIGPMSLLTYDEVRPWARAIQAQVVARQMPPWHADPHYGHFVNDRSLEQREIDTIVAWVGGGAPGGDPRDAPPPVEWPAEGWLVQPDVIVTLPDYPVAANGVIEWENFAVPSPFATDTWITSIELLPSEPSTVHHMCFEFQPRRPEVVYNRYEWAEVPRDDEAVAIRADRSAGGSSPQESPRNRDVWVLTREVGSSEVNRRFGRPTIMAGGSHCYVPGMSLHDYRPFEAGQLVPGGSDMVFNLHYQTTGRPLVNRMKVGFTLAKAPPSRKFVQIAPSGATAAFAIPPHESNYRAPVVELEIRKDAELVWMSPHMHVRGKDMTWSLTYPDGREEIVLRVADYQYTWQLQYQTRVKVPAGSMLRVVAHYDNSARNRYNPNPNVWVYPGNQAWEEMMVPFTWFVVDVDVDERELTNRYVRAEGA